MYKLADLVHLDPHKVRNADAPEILSQLYEVRRKFSDSTDEKLIEMVKQLDIMIDILEERTDLL